MDTDGDLPEIGSPTRPSAQNHLFLNGSLRHGPLHHSASVPVNSTFRLSTILPESPPLVPYPRHEAPDWKSSRSSTAVLPRRSAEAKTLQHSLDSKHSQRPRTTPGALLGVDWGAPGGALHAHLTYANQYGAGPESPGSRAHSAASSPARTSIRPKAHITATGRADRGPRFAFGGRDEAIGGDSLAKRAGKGRGKGADAWLGDWQPKPREATQGSERELNKRRTSLAALMTPALTWAVPDSPGGMQLKALAQAPIQPKGVVNQETQQASRPVRSMSDPASLMLPLPKQIALEGSRADEEATSPKRVAMARLAALRNLRRIPVSSSAPSSPVAPASLASPLVRQPSSALSAGSSALQRTASADPPAAAPKKSVRKPAAQKAVPRGRGVEQSAGNAEAAGDSAGGDSPGSKGADGLDKCEGCGRTFNAAAFEKHSRICATVFKAQRAAYAAEKAKVAGKVPPSSVSQPQKAPSPKAGSPPPLQKTVSLSQVAAVAALPRSKRQEVAVAEARGSGELGKKIPKWKQQSGQLRAAMLTGRPDKLGEAVAAFPGAVMQVDDSLVPCPHCGRRFAELTAERHIPKCKETVHKATRLAAGGGKAAYMRNVPAAKSVPKGLPRRK